MNFLSKWLLFTKFGGSKVVCHFKVNQSVEHQLEITIKNTFFKKSKKTIFARPPYTLNVMRGNHLYLVVIFLIDLSSVHGLFGLRKKSKGTSAASVQDEDIANSSKEFMNVYSDDAWRDQVRRAINAAALNFKNLAESIILQCLLSLPYFDDYIFQNRTYLKIRGIQEPSGLWRMPEGTILPKDPASMARIIEIGNDLGEMFHCFLPKRRKPYNAQWLDIPQVPVIEDISKEEAESHLRLSNLISILYKHY